LRELKQELGLDYEGKDGVKKGDGYFDTGDGYCFKFGFDFYL